MLCLVRDEKAQSLLPEIAEYLANARPNSIPHALHQYPSVPAEESAAAPETPDEPVSHGDLGLVAPVLLELAKGLSQGGHKKYGRIGFRRFELTYWLMHERLPTGIIDSDGVLEHRIREFELARKKRTLSGEGAGQALAGSVPWWVPIVVKVVPSLWFRARLRMSARYRWFLRQSFLAPQDPGTFLGFTRRLTGWLGENPKTAGEDAEQLLGILVNAFLEDVRRAYRRGRRRWWWRPIAARRTMYPVILLDRITRRNGGYRLLETVNRVRNETGLFDPLLFISGSRQVPPDALPLGAKITQPVPPMDEAGAAYKNWHGQFVSDSRARRPRAWYLSIQCTSDDKPASGQVLETERLRADQPPWWSRTGVVVTELVVVIALLAGAGVLWRWNENRAAAEADNAEKAASDQWRREHCGLDRADSRAKYLVTIGNECIGLSAEPLPIFKQPQELLGVQEVIAKQNGEAEQLHRDTPARQFVTVAYISEMSAAGDILSSEIERLQGIAAQQRRQLDGNVADPLVRILFVNAGHEMRQGPVAAGMLARLMEEDRSIVGAVGLAVSSRPTVDTIKALGAAGIPMIAAPLTADNLQNESPLYYQVSPQNRREAQMAAKYARYQLGVTGKVVVVSADNPDDLYATSLTADALAEFGNERFAVERRIYTPSPALGTPDEPSPRDVGQGLCGTDGLVFYTGRPADFAQMLDGINGACNYAPPKILAGDDISRYVADAKSRERFPQIPFDHLALALGGQNCYSGGDLNTTLRDLFPERCASTRDSFLTDDAPTAYDALTGIVAAVNKLQGTKITPAAVWHMITRLTGSARIDGASGIIDFGRDGSQIPLNKFLAIMRVQGVGAPQVQATCGEFRDQVPASWCP